MSAGQIKGTPDMKSLTEWELLAHGSHWGKNGTHGLEPGLFIIQVLRQKHNQHLSQSAQTEDMNVPTPPTHRTKMPELESLLEKDEESYSRTEQGWRCWARGWVTAPEGLWTSGDIQEGSTRSQYFFHTTGSHTGGSTSTCHS